MMILNYHDILLNHRLYHIDNENTNIGPNVEKHIQEDTLTSES